MHDINLHLSILVIQCAGETPHQFSLVRLEAVPVGMNDKDLTEEAHL